MNNIDSCGHNGQNRSGSESLMFLYVGVFTLAFVLRAVFAVEWERLPYGRAPLLDALAYDMWARTISDGQLLRGTAFYQSPLYPYFLGLLYRLFGHDTLIAGLANAALGAGGVTFLCAVARRFGTAASIGTGLLGAFYQPLVFYAIPLMKESLAFFLLSAFALFAVRAVENNKARDYLMGGAALSLAVVARGNVLFVLPVFYAAVFAVHRAKALKNAALSFVAFVLCLAPTALHNYAASGAFIPVNYADGFNLYVGHWASANGRNNYPPEVSTNPIQEEIDVTQIARERTGKAGPSDVSRYWRNRALCYIAEHPGRELSLLRNKFLAFWSGSEIFDNYNVTFIRKNFGTALAFTFPFFGLISALAAFGAVALGRRFKREVLLLVSMLFAYMASLLAFYVTERYRLLAAVFLLPLAGAALPEAFRLAREKAYPLLSCAVFASALFALLAHRPVPSSAISPDAFNWGIVATMYMDAGEYQKSVDAMHKALELSPQEAGFLPISRAAEAEHRLGHEAESERLYRLSTELFPKESGAWFYLGRMHEERGELKDALKVYRKSIELGSRFTNSYIGLARVYAKLGDWIRAKETIEAAAKVDPYDPEIAEILTGLRQAPRR